MSDGKCMRCGGELLNGTCLGCSVRATADPVGRITDLEKENSELRQKLAAMTQERDSALAACAKMREALIKIANDTDDCVSPGIKAMAEKTLRGAE
jgi:hypothetical protein